LSLIIEILIWGGLVSTFLYLYITRFNAPFSVIKPHALMIGAILLASFGARVFIRKLPLGPKLSHGVAASLISLPWILIASWYLLVLVGLSSWGRVITWPMLKTYAQQFNHLTSALGISSWIVAS